MLKRIEPNLENAVGVQRVVNEHYVRLGVWSKEEVAERIANPADPKRVKAQLIDLDNPKNKRVKAGNLTPVYAGLYVGVGAMALKAVAKLAPYKPRFSLPGTEPYLNIQELVVSDPTLHGIAIAEALDFAIKEMGLSRQVKASTEVFDLFGEQYPYDKAGFVIDDPKTQSYDFGTKKFVDVDKLVKPNLIRND